jgi:hypothetical protein
VVARRPHISASQLVAFAARHPIQRHGGHLQSEGRLTIDVVARGTHECLRIHWGTPRERKGQVKLFERLGGGKPLSLLAWCRINQVAKDPTRLDARVAFGDGAKGGDVRVGQRSLNAVPRIGLIDPAGVQQQLFGRGQRLRSPLLVAPVRLGVQGQHRQQLVEAASVEQRAVAERAGLGVDVGVGALPAVGHDMLHQR